MQLRQGGSDEFLPQRRCSLPVEIDVGHRIDGIVTKSSQVISVGVGVIVIVMLPPRG